MKRSRDVPLGYLAEVRPSSVDKRLDDHERSVRLCNYTDVYYGDHITGEEVLMHGSVTPEEFARFRLRHDDVLITKDSESPDDIAVPAWVARDPPDVVLGYHTTLIRPCAELDGRYLYWTLQADPLRAYFSQHARGVTRFALRQQDITAAPIPTPRLSVQRSIADYLDVETRRIDALRTSNEALRRLVRERHERFVIMAVAEGMDHEESVSSGEIGWLDVVAETFPIGPYALYGRTGSGHTPSRSVPEYWLDCDIPWVTTADVQQLRQGFEESLADTAHKISRLGMANSAARLHPAGTVFLSRTASVGFAGVMAVPMATSQDFFTWTPDERLVPEYLLWSLRAMRYAGHFDRLMYGSTHKTIYVPDLMVLRGPVPPIDDQRRIVSAIREQRDETRRLLDGLKRANRLLTERRTALITAAVTGELEV